MYSKYKIIEQIENIIMEYLHDFPSIYDGKTVEDDISRTVHERIVSLVDKGKIQVNLDWTLKVKD
jgi:hypothetical protein